MGDWQTSLAGPHGLLLRHARQSNEPDLIDCLLWLHCAVLGRYELAMGTVVRMEVQLVITMFHRQEGARGDAAVTATTYSRGDCLAWAYQHGHQHGHGHEHGHEHEHERQGQGNQREHEQHEQHDQHEHQGQHDQHEHEGQDRHGGLTALSTPVGGLTINGSTHTLHEGARVTQTCDGHHEKVSLEDQDGFERHVHTHAGADLGTADYVELLGHASAWVGGGDDITIVAAKLMPMPGR